MLSGYFYSHYKFQFTPLREGRPHTIVEECVNRPFQFTPLREGRQLLNETRGEVKYFNSRPSARGDNFYKEAFDNLIISIHAPPRGATSYFDSVPHKATKFQFTPLREGRLPLLTFRQGAAHFNSRPSARGDDTAHGWGRKRWKFQFTPLREGRPETR